MPDLSSFPENGSAVVIGASGGLGRAFAEMIAASGRFATVHALSRKPAQFGPTNIRSGHVDILSEESIQAALADVEAPRLVIVASGILHDQARGPEKSWRALNVDWMENVMRINAFGPALVAKHALPKMPRDGKSCFAAISARVGSISDNRLGGWYGYRASKAALNMLLKTLSVEFARTHAQGCILGLHPGTVDTSLSQPFQKGVPGDKLFTPAFSANAMLSVINANGAEATGGLFAWDGQPIPF